MIAPAPQLLESSLSQWLGKPTTVQGLTAVAGGDSHQALQLRTGKTRWFVKWNHASAYKAFLAEAEGLAGLNEHAPDSLTIPKPLGVARQDGYAWLILPWFELHNQGNPDALGKALAQLHRRSAPRFGWPSDNFLGASLQTNQWNESWGDFWWRCRMKPQLHLAINSVGGESLAHFQPALKEACARLLTHQPEPALVHGDLWSGNHGYDVHGMPVLFDPAPYFGDRETDLAMMQLFGGFPAAVLTAYEQHWPLSTGAERRITLYQLYHLLNHMNIFGSGWLPRVQQAIINILENNPGS